MANFHGKGMEHGFPAFSRKQTGIKEMNQPNHSSYQNTGPNFHVDDQVIKMIKEEIETLNEKVALYRKSRRDRKRKLLELYDRPL